MFGDWSDSSPRWLRMSDPSSMREPFGPLNSNRRPERCRGPPGRGGDVLLGRGGGPAPQGIPLKAAVRKSVSRS